MCSGVETHCCVVGTTADCVVLSVIFLVGGAKERGKGLTHLTPLVVCCSVSL